MTKWKDLHDTNPEPTLLDAIAHAEKQPLDIQEQAMRALDILECADVMHEFEDHLWIQVDREQWEEFTK